ncbi:MAG: YfhO family protein [Candidatus Saganbacteria bacterium]|nr:YfhO family protein [Candidatus Saganbacteria bacterium]
MVEQVMSGHVPLWNPYIFCGFPLLATLQIGFFYPLTAIYYMLPFNLAFNYYIILHYFLAACFVYLLLRHYVLSRPACFFGGIVFAFSGYLLSVSNMNTSLASVIWLPLVLLFFDRIVTNQGARFGRAVDSVILGILLAIQFLGGEPTIIYVSFFFLVAYAAVFCGSFRNFLKTMGSLIVAGIISLGLVAVQLLPFLELSWLSDRVVRINYGLVTFRSFPPRELLTFIFPYFYGNLSKLGGYTEVLLGKVNQDWLISPYLGILPLIFAFLSFLKNKKLALFFALVAVFSLFLAFGKYTPFYRIVFLIPGVSMIRFPVKYLFLSSFCLAILASLGFDGLLDCFGQNRRRFFKLLFFFIPLLIVILIFYVMVVIFRVEIFNFLAQKYSDIPNCFFERLAKIIAFNLHSLLFVVLFVSAFVILLLGAALGKLKKGLFAFIVLVLVLADLFSNGHSIVVSARKEVFSQTPETYQILEKEKGLFRFFYVPELLKENRMIYGENYSEALFNTKDNLASNWHIPYHFFDFYGYASIKPKWLFGFYNSNFTEDKIKSNFKFLSLYNVKYVASYDKVDIPALKLLRHKYRYGINFHLYENTKVLPRAYVLNSQNKPEFERASASILLYEPSRVDVLVELDEEGYLFLADAYYPGWKAFVGKKEVSVEKVNGYFRGVKLGSGKHLVKFVYDPLSFKIGATISLLTFMGLVFGGLYYFSKRQNKQIP